ncbi:MAG: nuclear transport factor 2 family protein [Pseudonocardiales bacterium]|nr:nuclear transport factor 2 family protein [Pseudonocardiales bacterium]
MNHEQRLRDLYDAVNAREIDVVLAAMTEDVDGPNAWEGRRVYGREAVRSYWNRQWAELGPRVKPVMITTRPDGCIAVDVHQVVGNLNG